MSLSIREIQPQDAAPWDRFVLEHPHGSPFHLIAWKRSIEETFGFRPIYLVAMEDDRVRGILPLFLVKNVIVGKALISSPFATYGGILADSPEIREAIGVKVRELGEAQGVDYIELRNVYPEQCVGSPNVSRYVTFSQPVNGDEEALLQGLPTNMRSKVRRAIKRPFSARRQKSDFRSFAALHAANYRRLGTPSFPLRHYSTLLKHFGDRIDVCEILLNGDVVAGSMNFLFRDQVQSFYVASDERYHEFLPNNYLYFENMRWAGDHGYRYFDFGRSKKESGAYEFKRRWGVTPRELPYEVLLVKRKDLPNFSPANPKFQLAIRVWKKLPLRVTRAMGPHIVRLFP
jgi:FemAB-related protein (PEP-CTERM system-associated)